MTEAEYIGATVTVGPFDVGLLRVQRDRLLDRIDVADRDDDTSDLAGVVNLLDHMLDRAEGFA